MCRRVVSSLCVGLGASCLLLVVRSGLCRHSPVGLLVGRCVGDTIVCSARRRTTRGAPPLTQRSAHRTRHRGTRESGEPVMHCTLTEQMQTVPCIRLCHTSCGVQHSDTRGRAVVTSARLFPCCQSQTGERHPPHSSHLHRPLLSPSLHVWLRSARRTQPQSLTKRPRRRRRRWSQPRAPQRRWPRRRSRSRWRICSFRRRRLDLCNVSS